MVVSPINESVHVEFLYTMLGWSNLKSVISEPAQPKISRKSLAPLKQLLPNEGELKEYKECVELNHEGRLSVYAENSGLVKIRGWLLPMLMNGQLTIK